MPNIENRNYSDFQNVNVKGSPAQTKGGVYRFVADGSIVSSGTWDSTLVVTPISGSTVGSVNGSVEAPYLSIANAGLNIGTGYIRYVPTGGSNSGTISVNTTYLDTDRAWQFPNKSGVFPIMGTFVVQIPANSGLVTALSTLVTVSGIRAEDAVVVQFNKGVSAGYNLINTAYIIDSASPGNGNILLTYFTGAGGTAYCEQICSYLAMR